MSQVSKQLFTDQEAAAMIEEMSPSLARTVFFLVYRGQTPAQIHKRLSKRFKDTVLVPLIKQAACHYQTRWTG